MARRTATWIGAVLATVFFLGPTASRFLTDYLWFRSLDLGQVFMTMVGYRAGIFTVVLLIVTAFIYGNYRWARTNIERQTTLLGTVAAGTAGFSIAYNASNSWDTVLMFVHQSSFGIVEPLTGTSVSFFVYTYPLLSLLVNIALVTLVITWLFVLWVYISASGEEDDKNDLDTIETMLVMEEQAQTTTSLRDIMETLRDTGWLHVRVLAGTSLIAFAGNLVLKRFGLFLTEYGAVNGVGYTQSIITMPWLSLTAVLCLFTGLLIVAGHWMGRQRLTAGMVAVLVIVGIGGFIAGAGVQSLVVGPDEFNREQAYLQHQINMTRQGLALDRIQEQQFRPSPNLTIEQIQDNPGTMDNIRLWDYRPLQRTYNELQIFRTYYQFSDVDIDRYTIDGREKQVMLSPREIDHPSLPARSQTWVNRHLVYTHGFGLAMSPVDQVTDQGLPELYVKDIPPKESIDINVTQPRIYYGEETHAYAITNTETDELDYPKGESNVYGSYQGDGGVAMDSLIKRALFAWRFGDPQILLSGSLTEESRIQIRRTVQDRVHRLAPFLEFDDDPYMVVTDDGLKWIYDAYTTSDSFPYAEHQSFNGEQTNYMRNSVKVVIDAYSGETTFYIADNEDPLINTYSSAFPGMFQPLDTMPDDLRDHLRYPEDFFTVQTRAYFDYHMTDPRVFYNREDQWRTPEETLRGTKSEIEPYYVMMQLPDGEQAEFMMIQPFIPQQRENLIGWVGARSDTPNYGELRSYLFSKQELVFGPAQVDARIDQDTDISQRFTLWSQQGSSVFRGNMLVLPIEDSIIYVEPVFLVSEGSGALPQLRRTIVAHNDRLTMQPTLDGAIKTLFGEVEDTGDTGVPPQVVRPEKLDEARELYRQAQEALQQGDFTTYSTKIEQLGKVLEDDPATNTTR